MRLLSTPAAVLDAAIAVLGLSVPDPASVPPALGVTVESWSGLTLVRALELDEIGFAGPTGLDRNERLGALVVTQSTQGRSRVTAFTGDENLVGRVRLPWNVGDGGVVVDPESGRTTVVAETGSVSIARYARAPWWTLMVWATWRNQISSSRSRPGYGTRRGALWATWRTRRDRRG